VRNYLYLWRSAADCLTLLHALAGRLTNASIEVLDRPSESEGMQVTATGVHTCQGTINIDGLMNNGWPAVLPSDSGRT
jgi:hypothetical protein